MRKVIENRESIISEGHSKGIRAAGAEAFEA
jgi:hypothetical protein